MRGLQTSQDAWDWIVRLGGGAAEPSMPWEQAWQTAQRTCEHWSPRRHLIRYLSSCAHRSIRPSAVTWIRFLVDDEQKEAREIQTEVALRVAERENDEVRHERTPESLREWRRRWLD